MTTPTPLAERIGEVLALADKATPGPWKYDDGITDDETGDRGKPQCIASVNLDVFGKLIAEPYGRDPDGHESDACIPSLSESDANGLLIAAVPKMADLLRECAAEIERKEKKIRALRNRLIFELQTNVDGPYEYRRAVAEYRVNEFEVAFDKASQ